jgi:hypothetical protein
MQALDRFSRSLDSHVSEIMLGASGRAYPYARPSARGSEARPTWERRSLDAIPNAGARRGEANECLPGGAADAWKVQGRNGARGAGWAALPHLGDATATETGRRRTDECAVPGMRSPVCSISVTMGRVSVVLSSLRSRSAGYHYQCEGCGYLALLRGTSRRTFRRTAWSMSATGRRRRRLGAAGRDLIRMSVVTRGTCGS